MLLYLSPERLHKALSFLPYMTSWQGQNRGIQKDENFLKKVEISFNKKKLGTETQLHFYASTVICIAK